RCGDAPRAPATSDGGATGARECATHRRRAPCGRASTGPRFAALLTGGGTGCGVPIARTSTLRLLASAAGQERGERRPLRRPARRAVVAPAAARGPRSVEVATRPIRGGARRRSTPP